MIYPAIGWIENCTVPSAQAELLSNQIEFVQLTWYPLHSKVIID